MGKGHISHRHSIRWLPNEASEPTSTLVLTSPSGWYIDVRLLLSRTTIPPSLEIGDDELLGSTKSSSVLLPASAIDWAFTGTSKSTPATEGKPAHSEWNHWVDSKAGFHDDSITDAGDMFPVSDTRVLETGSMPNPATGLETEYEEVWDDISVSKPSSWSYHNRKPASCLIFVTEDMSKETRGCVMRLGSWCQGVLRVGEDVWAERWKWVEADGNGGMWVEVARVGRGVGCSVVAFRDDMEIEVGKEIEVEGRVWKVREADWEW